jgi:hypothetical protein
MSGSTSAKEIVVVAQLAMQAPERHRRPLMWHQVRDGLPGLRDDDPLAGGHALQQPGQVRLGLMDVDIDRHGNLRSIELNLV